MNNIQRIMLAIFPILWAMSALAFDIDGISYQVLSETNKTACVARQTATNQLVGNVVIPRQVSYGGNIYEVTEISGWAFSDCKEMTSITIPATVQSIGYSAFWGCTNLKYLNIEDIAAWCSVTHKGGTEGHPLSIAHRLFLNGVEVKTLVIPEGVTAIAHDAFHDASGITSVVIPSSVTQIGDAAFAGCVSMEELSIGNGVQGIGAGAFSGCRSLTEVTVPEGVERLSGQVFYGCGKLASIHLPQSLQSIGYSAFEACNSLTSVVIPNQVTVLGSRAFYECKQLTSVRLPDNITKLDEWTFTRCYQLKDINLPKNLQQMCDYSLFWCSSIEELTLPSTLTDISQSALLGCIGLRSLIVEEGNPNFLTENDVLFNSDKTTLMLFPAQNDMTHYDVPSTVKAILPCAFSHSQLKSITLPPTLTRISNSMLSDMPQLENITIPATVTEIGSSAFSGCTSLKEVDIPNSVQSIGLQAFYQDSALVRVHLPESLARIEGGTFRECASLSELNIPERVNYIGVYAFSGCSSLTSIQIPSNVTTIDSDAFWGCSSLEKLVIGASVTELKGGTFCECNKIRQIWSYIEEPFDVCDYELKDHGYTVVGKCFPDSVTSNAVLYVPQGSIEKYRSKTGWRDFKNIVALPDNTTESLLGEWGLVGWKDNGEWVEVDSKYVRHEHFTIVINEEGFVVAYSLVNEIIVGMLTLNGSEMYFEGRGEMTTAYCDLEENLFFEDNICSIKRYTLEGNLLRLYYTDDDYFVFAKDFDKNEEPVTFTKDQMATIILPSAPDASKGKYYRLDRVEDGQIIFEQELQPRARVPYIIVPDEDFCIDPRALDLSGLNSDTVSIDGISFIGTYTGEVLPSLGGEGGWGAVHPSLGGEGGGSFYYDIIDTTPDCTPLPGEEQGERLFIGALRAYLLVNWSDPYNPGGTRGPNDKLEIVLKDDGTGSLTPTPSPRRGEIYDLSGKKIVNSKSSNNKSYRGIFIEDGKKKVSR